MQSSARIGAILGALATTTGALSCGSAKPDVVVTPAPATSSYAPSLIAAASASSTSASSGPEESNDPDIRKMLKKLVGIRGLKAKKAIPGVELDRKALIQKIKDKVAREIPPEEIRREGDWLKLYGFFPVDKDYLGETMRLLEAQLAGFYEPNDGTMYIAGDMDEMSSTATLAHELVHALQDQYYDLKSRSAFHPGESDAQTALSCLAEGDATSVMTDVILKRVKMTALDQSDQDYDDEMRASMNVGVARTVPMIMRTSLVAPYVEGIKFRERDAARRRISSGGCGVARRAHDDRADPASRKMARARSRDRRRAAHRRRARRGLCARPTRYER